MADKRNNYFGCDCNNSAPVDKENGVFEKRIHKITGGVLLAMAKQFVLVFINVATKYMVKNLISYLISVFVAVFIN